MSSQLTEVGRKLPQLLSFLCLLSCFSYILFSPDIVGAALCVWCVCCAFRKIPSGTFPPGGVFFFFFKIPPLPLSYPRGDGDRFPQKIYLAPRGELRGYYGISALERDHLNVYGISQRGSKSTGFREGSLLVRGPKMYNYIGLREESPNCICFSQSQRNCHHVKRIGFSTGLYHDVALSVPVRDYPKCMV